MLKVQNAWLGFRYCNDISLISDTQPKNIKYSHHALPNGELVRADTPTQPVFEFTQEDLNERRILFKHIGAAFGRIMLWVSDGQYYARYGFKYKVNFWSRRILSKNLVT